MADADAIVDHLAATAFRIPARHIRRAELELQRRRQAVERVVPIRLGCLSMGVDVDEAGRDDEPPRVDRVAAA